MMIVTQDQEGNKGITCMKSLDLIRIVMSLSIQGCNRDIYVYLGKNLKERERGIGIGIEMEEAKKKNKINGTGK
jgi:hypothetical protein